MTGEKTTTATEERARHCFVRHPDAGGKCQEPATMEVYGLSFCTAHGEEARLGALVEEKQDAEWWFDRFKAPHVPSLSSEIERGLKLALDATRPVEEDDYYHAIIRAHEANVPEDVRQRVRAWEEDERPGYGTVLDYSLDTLFTIHKLLRIAHKAKRTWLVEVLEMERQLVAVEAAVALEGSVCASR